MALSEHMRQEQAKRARSVRMLSPVIGWILVDRSNRPVSWHRTFYEFDPNEGGHDNKRQVADQADKKNAPHRWAPIAITDGVMPSQAALDSPSIAMPPGLSREEKRQFILKQANDQQDGGV